MNDIGGSRKPFDMIYEGTDAMVMGDLTVWNWAVWERIKALPNPNATPGQNVLGDIGTLMLTEGMAYPLWCHYPHFSKAAMSAAGMVAGHRFLAAFMMGPMSEEPGTKANRMRVQWMCMRAYDKSTGKFICSDNNMAGIPAVPPSSPLGV